MEVAKPIKRKEQNIAVFIDLDNTNISYDNLLEVFSILQTKGEIVYGKLYGYTDDRISEFEEIVAENRLETTGKMRFKTDGVSVVDTRLIVDCIFLTQQNDVDIVFVWAGVGDMVPIFSRLQKNGCKVMTIDLPDFDCNNKFVDQKIKLFSSHQSVKNSKPNYSSARVEARPQKNTDIEESTEEIAIPKNKSLNTVDSILATQKIPQLPRKKGAPEFGIKPQNTFLATDNEDEDEDDDFDLEDDDFDDDDFDDFDVLDGEEDEDEIDDGSDVLDETENEKLLALTQNMLASLRAGKDFDPKGKEAAAVVNEVEKKAEVAAKSNRPRDEFDDFGDLGGASVDNNNNSKNLSNTRTGKTDLANTISDTAAKSENSNKTKTKDVDNSQSNYGFDNPAKYDAEQNDAKPEKLSVEDTNEFNDFGDL